MISKNSNNKTRRGTKTSKDPSNNHFVLVGNESNSPGPPDEDDLISNENDSTRLSINKHKKADKKNASFVIAETAVAEARIILSITFLIAVQCLCELGTATIVTIMVGNYYHEDKYLSAVGIGSSFVAISGLAIPWGFTTALYTLFPQAMGHSETSEVNVALRVHTQRAFYIVTIVACPLVILQFHAGKIMVAMGASPPNLENIITNYALTQIPYIFGIGYLTILQRFCQAYEYNKLLTLMSIVGFIFTIPVSYVLMFVFNFGYIGAGIGKAVMICLLFIILSIYLIFFDSSVDTNIFRPLHWRVIFNYQGMKEYIALALPGLFQGGLDWCSLELIVVLTGYVTGNSNNNSNNNNNNSSSNESDDDSESRTIAITSNVIMYNLFLLVVSFGLAIANGISIRTGKYVGLGNIHYAKRAVMVGFIVGVMYAILFSVLFAAFNKDIPKLFTQNEKTIQVASQLCLVMIFFTFCTFMQQGVSGVFRALGKPKIAANATIVGYGVAFSLLFIIFFGLELRKKSIFIGCALLWLCLSLSKVVSVITQLLYWKFKVKWQNAHTESQRRLKQTLKQASTSSGMIEIPQIDDEDVELEDNSNNDDSDESPAIELQPAR